MAKPDSHLVLKGQRLRDIPDLPPAHKAVITFLDLTNNHITSLALVSSFSALTLLRVCKNHLRVLPKEIGLLVELKILDLSSNKIPQIPASFSCLTRLQELALIQNDVSSLPLELMALSNLQRFYITANRFTAISPHLTTFHDLRDLDCSNNSFRTFPKSFLSCKNLTALRCDFNALSRLPSSFSSLIHLSSLSLSFNSFPSFPTTLTLITTLTFLDISHNSSISSLPETISSLVNLRNFSSTHCNLHEIPHSFSSLSNLTFLSVSDNPLSSLPSLASLSRLSFACFDNCLLSSIQFAGSMALFRLYHNLLANVSFSQNASFDLIDVSSNNLKNLPDFSPLANLLRLDLSHNNLKNSAITLLPKTLVSLDLSDNCVSVFPPCLFECRALQILNFSTAKLVVIPSQISSLSNLEQLILIHNQLSTLPETLARLTKLSLLFLQSNKFDEIPTCCCHLPSLVSLSFSNNALHSLPPHLSLLTRLASLDLSCNNLTKLNLPSSSSLTDLNVSYNRLTSINPKLDLRLLFSLNITGNPIDKLTPPKLSKIQRFLITKLIKKPKPEKSQPDMIPPRTLISTVLDDSHKPIPQFDFPAQIAYFPRVESRDPQIAFSEMQGRRPDMQDSACIISNFCGGGYHLLCLFDGHGGSSVSRLCATLFPGLLAQRIAASMLPLSQILSDVFLALNDETKRARLDDGSVANVVLVTPFKYISANCGDSRALLVRGNSLEQLSFDHKPTHPEEYARLRAARGFIDHAGRLNGGLAVSRAIGDVDCQPAISAVPDVRMADRKTDDLAVVVACDGVWDVLSNQEVCEMVLMYLNHPADRIAAVIRDTAYARNSYDNITCIVCKFL